MKDIHKKDEVDVSGTKSETARREERVLQFWKDERIFEKSLEKESPQGEFVFYDGPPFATGLPHYGSLLSSIIKDVIPRYKTMRGFRVRRRWGWDCHGLPIENIVEKQLGLKTKKDIEALGIGKFNEAARAAVLQYAADWEKYIDRVGRWVDFKNSYKTMDNTYIESVWWALKQIYDKGLLYEGRKVLLYCPRCETPLAKAEIAMDNSYQEITEEAVTVKFKVKPGQKIAGWTTDEHTYILAWTTTPWTLPGNVALAVNENVTYNLIEQKSENQIEKFFVAQVRQGVVIAGPLNSNVTVKGKDLVGFEYEPLYEIQKVAAAKNPNTHTVLPADFVTTDEGTGVVHTAVIYGEDDFNLGLKNDLPMVPLLDASGKFNDDAPAFLRGMYIKDAEKDIKDDLRDRSLLFDAKNHTHSYPHCYRCGTPLIYNALSSWFINIQQVKERMRALNEEINWVPGHLKHGRFGNIVETAPDWTISRNRFWASPLPIWKNEKTGAVKIFGSLDEIKKHTKKSGNHYILMRHGESESNVRDILSTKPDNPHHLTERGQSQIDATIETLKDKKIDIIFASPFVRTQETAKRVAGVLGISAEVIVTDERLREIDAGEYDGRTIEEYHALFSSDSEFFTKAPPGGETYMDIKNRIGEFLYNIESRYQNKTILIITHECPAWLLVSAAEGLDAAGALALWGDAPNFLQTGSMRELEFVPLPHNARYELDLHRPYIDELALIDEDGVPLTRILEVVDCWVESGSMPFAEYHYPFENRTEFERRSPGDFIAEYIAQTRTWFYYMHAVSTLLFGRISFRTVVTTGTVLSAGGSKMSKSKGNYTDPFENLNKYGADALRYYLMTSPVMQAEDLNFRDEDLREAHNRVVNMLWNSSKFYELYAGEGQKEAVENKKPHVLDEWIQARQKELIAEYTAYFEAFDMIHAGRVLREFIDDLSTWYIRRSRDRFREAEKGVAAMQTLRMVLEKLSILAAPLMPFIAESIYRGVGGEKASVHLADWPEVEPFSSSEEDIIASMREVRRLVSLVLEQRAKAGIKVRQPLALLRIKNSFYTKTSDEKNKLQVDLLELIKDEVNIKEIIFDDTITSDVELDTTMTPELKREGQIRELTRAIQDLRKKEGLLPNDKATLCIIAHEDATEFLKSAEISVRAVTNISSFIFEPLKLDKQVQGEVVHIGDFVFTIALGNSKI